MQRPRLYLALSIAVGSVGASIVVACVGSEPDGSSAPHGGDPNAQLDSGATPAAPDAGLAQDAAPSLLCPLGCLPPAPLGWSGPSAFFEGPTSAKPTSCPAPYTLPQLEGHRGIVAPAATCGCGAATASGATCSAVFNRSTVTTCGDRFPVGTAVVPGSPCVNLTTGAYGTFAAPVLDAGSCSYPSPTKSLVDATFTTESLACALLQTAGCADRADCVATPVPAAPFTRICIHKPGDELCPSADYPNRLVTYRGLDDARECLACTGTPTGGSCGDTWGYSDGACTPQEPGPMTFTAGQCVSNPGSIVLSAGGMAPKDIICVPSGGGPTGEAVESDPVTVCCNR